MRKNGSVTVFFVLLLVLLTSVLFAFLEAARVSCLKAEAHLCTGQAVDAVRASYQPELWKDYHLMFWQQTGTDADRFSDLYQLQKDMIEKNQTVKVSHKNFSFFRCTAVPLWWNSISWLRIALVWHFEIRRRIG